MYALARVVVVRRIARRLSGRKVLPGRQHEPSIFDADAEQIVAALRKDGFDARLRLPAPIVQELASYRGSGSAESVPYSGDPPACLALVEKIAHDPMLLRIAALYLNAEPVYQGSRIWSTRPGEGGDPLETGARFHFDLYDYRSLTFLFYITDVDTDAAPHVCVRASHRLRRWRDQFHPRRHRSDEWLARLYGEDRLVTICGEAGTGIAEDPFCFHKVRLPARRERRAMQLLYTGGNVPAPSFNRVSASHPVAGPRSRDTD